MTQTFIVKEQETQLEQILKELIYALKMTYTKEDILKLSLLIIKEGGKQTLMTKKDIAVEITKNTKKYSVKSFFAVVNKAKKIKHNGVKESLSKDIDIIKQSILNSPEKTKELIKSIKGNVKGVNENFHKKTKEEKIELISVGLMGILIFFASAGGSDFEGGIPDTDLLLGIGFHRHIFSHSIIIGFMVEFLMRVGIEIINTTYSNLPPKHNAFWDKTHKYINKHKGIAIGAMWAGISVHLLKDSAIFGPGFKSYVGIPFKISTATHQGLFVANGIISSIFAFTSFKEKNDYSSII